MRYIIAFAILILILSQYGCGLVFLKPNHFKSATSSGSLQTSLSKDAVKELLGRPDSKKVLNSGEDNREVWNYFMTSEEDTHKWVLFALFSFGMGSFFPIGATEFHYIIFEDEKVIGWDMRDLYKSGATLKPDPTQ